ncbi:MAG: HAD family hydrolase [Planctomycetota bacterium]
MSSRPFLAVCFDMDGTLVDSEPTHAVVNRTMLERLGVAGRKLQRDYTGFPDEWVYRDMIEILGVNRTPAELKQMKLDLMHELVEHVTPMPGADRLVRDLCAQKVRLALVSASPPELINLYLRHFGWKHVLPVVASGSEPAVKHNKPSPDVYCLAARRLSLPPQRCVAVEDTWSGLRAARTSGMYTVGVRNGHNDGQRFEYACATVRGLRPLLKLGRGVLELHRRHRAQR